MAGDRLSFLLKEYDECLQRSGGDCEESVAILKSIVQAYVERNDDESAYRCQRKVCDTYAGIYGESYIGAQRARLYCRELMIRTAPLTERVRLCRAFWQDIKEDYGEGSVAARVLAPLYLACCVDAGEWEELRLLCAEIAAAFGGSGDEESRQLVALCEDFDIIAGEKSGDIRQLEAACLRAEAVFGKDSLYELRLRNEMGLVYSRNRAYEEAAAVHGRLWRISRAKYGKYALDTIRFQKNYVLELAQAGHPYTALFEAGRLRRAVEKCPDRNQCPDIEECFVMIYIGLGQKKLVRKHAVLSAAYNEGSFGPQDAHALKAGFLQAAAGLAYAEGDGCADFWKMLECMAAKVRRLYNLYLLSSDVGREKHFVRQNRGEYDICLGIALGGRGSFLTDEHLSALWEVVCNYKTLMGDCEFLHSAMSQRQDLAQEISLGEAVRPGDRQAAAEAERQLLELSRSSDFPGYMEAVHVRDIRDALREDEVLLDYYCVHFSDLEVYAAMAVTRHSLELVQLGAIGEVNALTVQAAEAICGERHPASSDAGAGNGADGQGGWPDALRERLFGRMLPLISRFPRVIVCPDGELYHFSFDLVLPDAEIVYAANPKDIARGRKGIRPFRQPIRNVNVFADPAFDVSEEHAPSDREEMVPERSGGLKRLPGTMAEAEIIRRIYGDKVSAFTRTDANARMFLHHCGADILHIGTHADSEDGGRIYLSGGFVTPRDIAALNMGNTRLAVLSACRTGIGEYRDYLGARGLRRAFQVAGAHAVIAAFWNISDIAAAVFMHVFYTQYGICGDCAAAMIHAKRYLKTADVRQMREKLYPAISDILINSGCLEEYRQWRDLIAYGQDGEKPFASPYYWAAFSLYDTFRD